MTATTGPNPIRTFLATASMVLGNEETLRLCRRLPFAHGEVYNREVKAFRILVGMDKRTRVNDPSIIDDMPTGKVSFRGDQYHSNKPLIRSKVIDGVRVWFCWSAPNGNLRSARGTTPSEACANYYRGPVGGWRV